MFSPAQVATVRAAFVLAGFDRKLVTRPCFHGPADAVRIRLCE